MQYLLMRFKIQNQRSIPSPWVEDFSWTFSDCHLKLLHFEAISLKAINIIV